MYERTLSVIMENECRKQNRLLASKLANWQTAKKEVKNK